MGRRGSSSSCGISGRTTGKVAIVIDDDGNDDNESVKGIEFVDYMAESQLESVMELEGRDLSEPHSSEQC